MVRKLCITKSIFNIATYSVYRVALPFPYTDKMKADLPEWFSKNDACSSASVAPITAPLKPPEADDKGVLSRMLLNDHKAGMEGLDKEKINNIIMEASKGVVKCIIIIPG